MTWTPSSWQHWSSNETRKQLIGAAQVQRANDPMAIIKFLAVAILMTVKNEYLIYEDTFMGIHDDENNVCL